MIFNKRRVAQLERRCELLEDDIRQLEHEVRDLQIVMGQLLGDGVEVKTEVQFIPADHILEQKH